MGKGLYGKYVVQHTDGTLIEPDAKYFVLRYDADVFARVAMRAYARAIFQENPDLARDIRSELMDTLKTKAGQKELDMIIERTEAKWLRGIRR